MNKSSPKHPSAAFASHPSQATVSAGTSLKSVRLLYLACLFLISCSWDSESEKDVEINAAQYKYDDIELSLHVDGRAINCRLDSFEMKKGTWRQQGESLELAWTQVIRFSDSSKTDSVASSMSDKEVWSIRKSEFGFHRLIPTGRGSTMEEVYLEENPAEETCGF